jgi:hypothetical protein
MEITKMSNIITFCKIFCFVLYIENPHEYSNTIHKLTQQPNNIIKTVNVSIPETTKYKDYSSTLPI